MAKKEWALVTGASSGIGLEFATILAEHGVNLIISSRNVNAQNSLAAELTRKYRVKVLVFPADLSHQDNVEKLVEFIDKQKIIPTYVVNNAGFGDFGYFTQAKWDKNAEMIDLNIKTLTYLTKVYAAKMKELESGKIVNVASGAAFQPGPLMSVYFASKAYVLHFSEAMAEELVGTGVTVTTLCPGPTESNFWQVAGKSGRMSIVPGATPSSRTVAEYGYRAMMRGDRIAIHGASNTIMAFLVRFAPRRLVTKIIKYGQAMPT